MCSVVGSSRVLVLVVRRVAVVTDMGDAFLVVELALRDASVCTF